MDQLSHLTRLLVTYKYISSLSVYGRDKLRLDTTSSYRRG